MKKRKKKEKKWDRAGKQEVADINSRGTRKTSAMVLIEFSMQIYTGKAGSFKE